MHHLIVKRVAFSLWILIALASAGFGWIAARAPATTAGSGVSIRDAGQLAFDRDCGRCHECQELATTGDQAARLVRKLASHGPASVEDDLAIVAYLVSASACSRAPAPGDGHDGQD